MHTNKNRKGMLVVFLENLGQERSVIQFEWCPESDLN